MPKFFIVFCFALFASAAFGASLGKDERETINERVRNACGEIIRKTFSSMMRVYRSNIVEEEEILERMMEFVNYGSRAMRELDSEIRRMVSVDENDLSFTYEGAPVLCPETVMMKLAEVETNVLDHFLNAP